MKLKIKELPISERPYEKLELYGAEMLSNSELLAIIIKTGTKEENSITIAQKVLKLNNKSNSEDLRFLCNISIEELTKKEVHGYYLGTINAGKRDYETNTFGYFFDQGNKINNMETIYGNAMMFELIFSAPHG